MGRDSHFAIVAALLAAVCFGTTGTAKALGAPEASALSVGGMRLIVGGGILGIGALIIAVSRRRALPAVGVSVGGVSFSRSRMATAAILGAIGVAAYQPTFFLGTSTNGVAVGTVVALGSAPIITGVIQWVRGRFPGRAWALATGCAVVGLVLLTGLFSGATALNPGGLFASLGAAASYVCYTLCGKHLVDDGLNSTLAMGAMFGIGAVFSVPIVVASSIAGASAAWAFTPNGLATIAWLGIVTVVVAYILFGIALRELSPATVSTLTLAEPITATLLGTILVHEQLTFAEGFGIVWILGGLALLVALPILSRRHKQVETSPTPSKKH